MITTFEQLAATVTSFAHRPDLLDETREIFIPLANFRLGRTLRVAENLEGVSYDTDVDAFPFELPDDFGEVFSVVFQNARGPITLQSTGPHGINKLPTTGQPPAQYEIHGGELDIRPRAPGNYLVTYFQIPVLDDENSTNAVLVKHPNLYIQASLIELHIWTQDVEMATGTMNVFQGELGEANRAHERRRYDAPAMIGV